MLVLELVENDELLDPMTWLAVVVDYGVIEVFTIFVSTGSDRYASFGIISLLNGYMPVHRKPDTAFSIVADFI